MATRKKDFRPDIAKNALLWCARHFCLCGKACSTGIVIAHIDQNGSAKQDNAMPLWLDCHERTGSYDPKHPLGRRYQPDELRARRNQVYEHYTSHLVPPIPYRLLKWDAHSRMLAFEFIIWVGLIGQGCGCGSLSHRGGPTYGHPKGSRHYNGAYLWNLNPRFGVNGHFPLPGKVHRSFTVKKKNIRARIDVTVIDIYERHHKLLPVGYVLTPSENDWYLEPVERELNIAEPRF